MPIAFAIVLMLSLVISVAFQLKVTYDLYKFGWATNVHYIATFLVVVASVGTFVWLVSGV